jgi:hypothetical protein
MEWSVFPLIRLKFLLCDRNSQSLHVEQLDIANGRVAARSSWSCSPPYSGKPGGVVEWSVFPFIRLKFLFCEQPHLAIRKPYM